MTGLANPNPSIAASLPVSSIEDPHLAATHSANLDLIHALNDFLHAIGLLPLSQASYPNLSLEGLGGLVSDHRSCSEIPADDISFLLSLVNVSLLTPALSPVAQHKDHATRLVHLLSRMALLPSFTQHVASHFTPILPELASLWLLRLPNQGRNDVDGPGRESLNDQDVIAAYNSHYSEVAKLEFRAVLSAFALLLRTHTCLFPFLVTFMRHPALATDPFDLLPSTVVATNIDLDQPLPSDHPLYQDQVVYHYLMSLYRILSIAPHLPFPGLVPNGWVLSPYLLNILKFHPTRGSRLLAWNCWRFWLGSAGFGSMGNQVRDQYVWQRSISECSLIDINYTTPWSSILPHLIPISQPETSTALNTNHSSQDWILVEEKLTGKWEVHLSSTQKPTVFYQVVSRRVDAWILAIDEAQNASRQRLANQKHSSSLSTESHSNLPTLSIQSLNLSRLVTAIEGIIVMKFNTFLLFNHVPDLERLSESTLKQEKALLESQRLIQNLSFVKTSSSSVALSDLASLLIARRPILISGPPSSGKNTIIRYIATQLLSKEPLYDNSFIDQTQCDQNLVILNLASRTLDAKSLLGCHTSSPKDPGKFIFVEGPLTRAMREGKWLVCQDIDRASDDVLSVINQVADLINHRTQYQVGGGYGGHGGRYGVGIDLGLPFGWLQASEQFLLLATRTCQDNQAKDFVGVQYWSDIKLKPMNMDDALKIFTHQTPSFSNVVREHLVAAWKEVSCFKHDPRGRGSPRLADLLKWAQRIKALLPSNHNLNSISQNPVLQEQIFLEAIDLFLASSDTLMMDSNNITNNLDLNIFSALSKHIDLNSERATYCLCRRIPDCVLSTHQSAHGAQKKGQRFVQLGRVRLAVNPHGSKSSFGYSRPFALSKSSSILLERLAACMRSAEPVLLVGETGTGKTSIVSFMANQLGKKLISFNLSSQSEASDLLGGFKPLDSSEDGKLQSNDLIESFIRTFAEVFNVSRNQEFIQAMRKAALKKRYSRLVIMLQNALRLLTQRSETKIQAKQQGEIVETEETSNKRRKISDGTVVTSACNRSRFHIALEVFQDQVSQFEEKFIKSSSKQMRFRFVEGPLVKALQQGHWVLLDEINLATPETLESLSGLLRHSAASVILSERGDLTPIPRHPDFRLIGCMNPATDVGKRDLPSSLRSKFTEIFVQPPDNNQEALLNIISQYLSGLCVSDKRVINDIADCYCEIRSMARSGSLADGTSAPPHYSMRTLSRALTFAADISDSLGLRRALVEGFLMAFMTTLDARSTVDVTSLIERHLVQTSKNPQAIMSQLPKKPSDKEKSFIQLGPFWLTKSKETNESLETYEYVLTNSVKSKIIDLARAVTTRRYPVLIQGPTSSGKTSLVEYLCRITGHSFVRINNHEHTDIQEYIGSYATDTETGRLTFKEGALVRALRRGEWVVLDELNLAPSDVLEALNRLLDDNRELLIPETQEIVRPHPNFMLFATQNPPGLYGGRKVLSRAFRNRFLELHFDDLPKEELEIVLCQRCRIAPSYAKKIVQVFVELQKRRQADKIFEEKHSFATLRDLFRWGGRGAIGYQELADDGYMLLAERSRGKEEKETVKEVLEQVMKVKIDSESLYNQVSLPNSLALTSASKRLFKLVSRALQFHEPVLLVGEAGSGKTSVCEALSSFANQRLRCINLHRNSEVGDLLGSQRPTRNREENIQAALHNLCRSLDLLNIEYPNFENVEVEEVVDFVENALTTRTKKSFDCDAEVLEQTRVALKHLRCSAALFTWFDGPLVQAMQEGDYVLLDEISLADDSVLERLNSLLEPERSIVLAERGGGTIDQMKITAHSNFEIMATMNPGGDFGKRELSPALRNRFTEIWVPLLSDPMDRLAVYSARLSAASSRPETNFDPLHWANCIISFSSFYSQSDFTAQLACRELSLRDGLSWCDFMKFASSLSPALAFIHGAQMTVLDRLGTAGFGQDLMMDSIHQYRQSCLSFLHQLAEIPFDNIPSPIRISHTENEITIGDFTLKRDAGALDSLCYSLTAPTAAHNVMRILRALQIPKAVLLEGSPGVGKTSLVETLARISGKRLRRINLSDQTDLIDLLGADVPAEDGRPGRFVWQDAAFLDALQNGDWVLLDEMNLAPQTVLEGLNSCLDHRGAVYIPEIDRNFIRHPDFKVFAAQNPHHQGGCRKGLPRSLIDRFTVVFMKEMEKRDFLQICADVAPELGHESIARMVDFNHELAEQAKSVSTFASLGSPWEFNLRDLGRWLKITTMDSTDNLQMLSPIEYLHMIYSGRFRTLEDQITSAKISELFFGPRPISINQLDVVELPSGLIVGHSKLKKHLISSCHPSLVSPIEIPPSLRHCAQALIRCLDLNWLPILTGPEYSGKTSLVKLLAARKGAKLRCLYINSSTDTTDLIGGFEQSHVESKVTTILENICQGIQNFLQERSLCRDDATRRLESIQRSLRILKSSEAFSCNSKLINQAIKLFKTSNCEQQSFLLEDLEHSLQKIRSCVSGERFEWIDGPVVAAMKRGEWLLVENSNFCNASVLDRLNPLFEGTGTLQLSEKGMRHGKIETIVPHPNFRVIFVFNSRYGELSRAMRNRGVEIAFLPGPPVKLVTQDSGTWSSSFPSYSTLRTLNVIQKLSALPNEAFVVGNLVEDVTMRWVAQALIHPPTEYPLLSRVLDHFFPTHHLEHNFKLLIHRLSRPELLEALESWARYTRQCYFFMAGGFDLATACQSGEHLLVETKRLAYQTIFIIVIAACAPLTPLLINSAQRSQPAAKTQAQPQAFHTSQVDLERFRVFVHKASEAILQLSLVILNKLQKEATFQAEDYKNLVGCLQNLQGGMLQLSSLIRPFPDYAAMGFALKVIEESLEKIPQPWKLHLESVCHSLTPLRRAHDISRWGGLVKLWQLFCPQWSPMPSVIDLSTDLEKIVLTCFNHIDTSLRAIYFEVAASLRLSRHIPIHSSQFFLVAEKLKEQLATKAATIAPLKVIEAHLDFGDKAERLIAVAAITAGFLDQASITEKHHLKLNDLLPHLKTLPSQVGVLFRSKAYLDEQKLGTDHVDLSLNLQILTLLTSPPVAFLENISSVYAPFNLLCQLTGSALLHTNVIITRLVETATTLQSHGKIFDSLNRFTNLMALTSPYLAIGRKSFCSSLLSHLFEKMESCLIDLAPPNGAPLFLEEKLTPTDSLESGVSRALRLWRVYVPDVPIDPLSVQTAHHAYLQSWMSRLRQLRDILSSHQRFMHDFSSNARVLLLDEEIANIELCCKELPQPSISRTTDQSILGAIFTELKGFGERFFANERLNRFVADISIIRDESELSNLRTQLETFSVSALSLFHRLSQRFPAFVDILLPIQALLHAIVADLTLIFQNATSKIFKTTCQVLEDFLAKLSISNTSLAAAQLRHHPLQEITQNIFGAEISQSLIVVTCIGAMANSSIKNFKKADIQRLISLYDTIWRLWALDRIKEQREAEEKAQEFKTRGHEIIMKSDEELEAEELLSLFPTEESQTVPKATSGAFSVVTPPLISAVCRLHLSVTLSEGEFSAASLFHSLRRKVVTAIGEKWAHLLSSHLDQSSLAFQLFRYHELLESIRLEKAPGLFKDFYTEGNVTEASCVVPLVVALAQRVEQLIQDWPDMINLKDIFQRCDQILILSSETPLARIIPFLEKLIEQVEEWQKYSCSENSLLTYQCNLTTLVVSWRRLELKSWATLVHREIGTFQSSTEIWWFHLYELLIRGFTPHAMAFQDEEVQKYLSACAVGLNEYMSNCNYGQFTHRLLLLQSFSVLLKAHDVISEASGWTQMIQLVEGVIYFYSHYQVDVITRIDEAKKLARREIEDLIRVASWKDVNIIALRQSSQKSHRQLYKCVKRFRTLLQSPMKDLLQRWHITWINPVDIRRPVILDHPNFCFSTNLDSSDWKSQIQSLAMPAYFSQVNLTSERLQRLVQSKKVFTEDTEAAVSIIESLATKIYLVAKELREEKIPSADSRESFARNLDLRKRKAFANLLKQLRLLGIGTCPTDQVLHQLSDPAVIMSQPLLGPNSVSSVKELCEACDEAFFALLNEMPLFRKFRTQHHADITASDMQRLLGSVESGLVLIIAERDSLFSLVKTIQVLEKSLMRMTDLLPLNNFGSLKLTSSELHDLCQGTVQCQNSWANTIQETMGHIKKLDEMKKTSILAATAQTLEGLASAAVKNIFQVEEIASISHTSLTLLKPTEAEFLINVPITLRWCIDSLEALIVEVPSLSFVLSPLCKELRNHQIESLPPSRETCHSGKAWLTLKKLTDSILIVTQELAKPKSTTQEPVDVGKKKDGLLKKSHLDLVKFTASCYLHDLLNDLKSFNENLSVLGESKEVQFLLSLAVSFIRSYFTLVYEHLVNYLRWHRSTIKLIQTVVTIGENIAQEGFCKPDFSEEDSTMDNTGLANDGTGLGNGQGGKDVGEEIESEDQLEGLQGDVDEQEKMEKDLTDEDKAVETQNDFDAQLENLPETEEDASSSQSDVEEDIDDGIGKVDPLDSKAVDEKFWEGENETDQTEAPQPDMCAKEEKAMPKDSDLAAKENQTSGEQNKPEQAEDEVNEKSELDENTSEKDFDLEKSKEDEELEKGGTEENEENEEAQPQHDAVPMMDHVDNTEALDLPEDLDMDSKSDKAEFSEEDSIMDINEMVPESLEDQNAPGEEENENDHQNNDEGLPDPVSDDIEPSNDAPEGQDFGSGVEGGGTNLAGANLDPTLHSVSDTETTNSGKVPDLKQQGQQNAGDSSNLENQQTETMEDISPQLSKTENGCQPDAQASETEANSSQPPSKLSKPNPLRDLGDAMGDWKRRLQEIVDATSNNNANEGDDTQVHDNAEVEYFQSAEAELTDQQAPGPATEDQACEELANRVIDDSLPESNVPLFPNSNLMPPSAEPLQLPEVGEQAGLVEEAVFQAGDTQISFGHPILEDFQPENMSAADEDEIDTQSNNQANEESLSSSAFPAGLWREYQQQTERSALQLTEQLRLILEPTTATRLQGDYRTGKRLNMRKLVSYLASDYTKDRIWLRRTKPAQRDYQIMLVVDDSKSMADARCAHLAFQTLALVMTALSRLEVGQMAIAKFGRDFEVLQPFGGFASGSNEAMNLVRGFTFSQQQTNVRLAVENALKIFSDARQQRLNGPEDTWQLGIIVSDGICQDHDDIRALLRKAMAERVMFVFVVLDSLHQQIGQNESDNATSSSIISMNTVSYTSNINGKMELKMERYLDSFPFDYYIVLREVKALPKVLSTLLRQFFDRINHI
ncbi:hypothetical protein O181_007427 [Austropuccinia psidii MF-1]|uniref:Midasin n=1 Tax=Austropuccinia psidii MF-1 TaxID=1389203 RepID=A0A9Q3GIG5_9BASI|nr:hypothetical protein [Austropuccinia psidii MF-1]